MSNLFYFCTLTHNLLGTNYVLRLLASILINYCTLIFILLPHRRVVWLNFQSLLGRQTTSCVPRVPLCWGVSTRETCGCWTPRQGRNTSSQRRQVTGQCMRFDVIIIIAEISFLLEKIITKASYCTIAEEVGHDFRGMCILLSRIICNILFLLTQQVDLGCVGVYCSLWQTRSN